MPEKELLSTSELLDNVNELNAEGNLQGIIDLLSGPVLDLHKDPSLYTEKAVAYLYLGNYRLAIELADKALAFNMKNARALVTKARAFGTLGEYDNALDVYKKGYELDPSDALFCQGLGSAYYYLQQYDKSLEYYQKGLDLSPGNADFYNGLGYAYYGLNQNEKSLEAFKKSIDINPNDGNTHNGLGNLYSQMGQKKDAFDEYQKSIELEPDYASPYFNRATYYFEKGQYEKAREDFEKYIKLSEKAPDYYTTLAESKILEIDKLLSNDEYNALNVLVSKIKKLLFFDGNCVTHYTSLTTAKAIILESSVFRLSEGAYLNDTSEGRQLLDFLEFKVFSEKDNSTIIEPFNRKPFIGSFVTSKKDNDLALWRMYGKDAQEEAKGCSITLTKDKFLNALRNKLVPDDKSGTATSTQEFNFYKVAYKEKGDNKSKDRFIIPGGSKDEEQLNVLMEELAGKVKKFVEERRNNVQEMQDLAELLNQIAYLFKSAEYQYEYEIRLVVKGIGFDKVVSYQNVFPRVYIELVNLRPIIERITLGPKIVKPDEWASAFFYSLNREGFNPEIFISKLPFK